ncbi:hypothetical protein [Marixanthomonas spongiae]|uniref:Uncharacterized protein n=1 Tax=Marixanthomonas spongiae TaxID=2174845 RepID=A0A2U0HTI2_9FLAO|nr:hypothetical protein [Marixanthomonas spongiae]PVW12166.1 hypothetical protein DDV96_15310 [Marixanthomonas spongiae]
MKNKEILKEVNELESAIKLISKDVYFEYYKNGYEVPDFFNPLVDYNQLKELHFTSTLLCQKVILFENKEFLVRRIIKVKIFLDNLLKNHKGYSKKKYEREFQNKYQVYNGSKIIQLNQHLERKKLNFIKMFLKLLKDNKIIESKSHNNLGIASLFLPIKGKGKIHWKDTLYSLKLVFDLLKESELIEYPSYFSVFMSEKFKILNKAEQLVDFKPESYKNASSNVGYDKAYEDWRKKIETLKVKLELPFSEDFK